MSTELKELKEAKLNFEKRRNIGAEGRNSEVFIAHDKQFNAEIVIKQISKSDFTHSNEFYKETKCLYASKHENVVSVYYSCEDDDNIFIGMPLYRKGSLESLINKRFLTVREIINYTIDFLSGLYHIHTKNLIHFDIKPTNILISDSNKALLTDFGLAEYTNAYDTAEQKRQYILHSAPERFSTTHFTKQIDIYQVGSTLYRLCNGSNMFHNQFAKLKDQTEIEEAITSGKFPDRNEFLPHIPLKLRKIIKKALELNPKDRFESALELMNDLSKVNENLDWQYQIHSDKNVWTLEDDKRIIEIELTNNGSNFNIESFKTMKSSMNKTSISKGKFTNTDAKTTNIQLIKLFKALYTQ